MKQQIRRLLAINPGSTSTKIATFVPDGDTLIREHAANIKHSLEELRGYAEITDQFGFRKAVILGWLKDMGLGLNDVNVFVGRGGFVNPVASGVYRVNSLMREHLASQKNGKHSSNLGGLIAHALAGDAGSDDAFIVDPVAVDEMDAVARISGMPELPRLSKVHALNHKAVGQLYAESVGRKYRDLNLVVVHLGGGISIAAHQRGRMIDVNNGLDGEGAFSPERTGGLPAGDLMRLCFSGTFTQAEMSKKIVGNGGLVAYLGTNSAQEVQDRVKAGDGKAKLVYQAMSYQVAKDIGAYAAVLSFDVDAIILTGGLAYDPLFCGWVEERVRKIAKIVRFPGGDEEMALAKGVYLGLQGKKEIREYRG